MNSAITKDKQLALVELREAARGRGPFEVLEGGGTAFDWEADAWSLSELSRSCGLRLSPISEGRSVSFAKLSSEPLRALLKDYLRIRGSSGVSVGRCRIRDR